MAAATTDVKTTVQRKAELKSCIKILQSVVDLCQQAENHVQTGLSDPDANVAFIYTSAQDILDAAELIKNDVVQRLTALSFEYQISYQAAVTPGLSSFNIANGSPKTIAFVGGLLPNFVVDDVVEITGAEDSANNQQIVVDAVSPNDTIQCSETVTANAADTTATLTLKKRDI